MSFQVSHKDWMFFDLLLKRYHPHDPKVILELLTQQDRERYQEEAISFPPTELSSWLEPAANFLVQVHPEWIVQVLSSMSASRRSWVLAALPKAISAEVCRLGDWEMALTHLHPVCESYLLQELAQVLQRGSYLPIAALPKTPLSPLLELSFEELEEVICAMGIRDLAEVVRGIVDQKLLRTLYSCLKPQEQKLLRIYIHQKQRLKSSPIPLQGWDKKSDTLRALYRERGLIRLSKALDGQSPYFLWHLGHLLSPADTERIMHYMRKETKAEIKNLLLQQLLFVISFVRGTAHDTI